MRSNPTSLYVHIPFCKSICSYCDFKKFIYNQSRVDDYFKSLFFELKQYKNRKYKTIYIGGGTPSCIDKQNLERLLKTLSSMLSKNYKEFAIENNVEDINEEYLKLLVKYKINRISVGVQTINDKYIKLCNRHHNKNMAIDNINLACKFINNTSIDMIYALPFQSVDELIDDIDFATSLPIKHLSYYSLLIEDNTVLKAKGYQDTNDETQAKMYEIIVDRLNKKGFKKYEVSNFAKAKKYQSFHNKVYWKNEHYDAVGLASSGYVNNVRYTNNDNIISYNKKDYHHIEETILSKKDILFDEIMMNLRLDEGIDINRINKKFNIDFYNLYKNEIEKYINMGLLKITNNHLSTTTKGCLLLNSILVDFLEQ